MAHTADYERAPALVPSIPNWWRVCFVHGDQTKYYRKLYGRKSHVRSLRGAGGGGGGGSPASPYFSAGRQDNDGDSM